MKILVDGTLLIPNLIPEDAGNYTCIPTNGILTPPSASAHLKVKRKGFFSIIYPFLVMLSLLSVAESGSISQHSSFFFKPLVFKSLFFLS